MYAGSYSGRAAPWRSVATAGTEERSELTPIAAEARRARRRRPVFLALRGEERGAW
jgi:hypothetical protein